MTPDFRVHDPGCARGQNVGHLSKVLFKFSNLCRYLTNHLLENIHIKAFGTIHGRLSSDSFGRLGPYPRLGLEVKIKDFLFFYLIESFVYEKHVLFYLTFSLRVHDQGWG